MNPGEEVVGFLSDDKELACLYANGVRPQHFFTVEMRELVKYAEEYFTTTGGMVHAPTEDILRTEFPFYDEIPHGTGGFTPEYIAKKVVDEFVKNTVANSLDTLITHLKADDVDQMVSDITGLSGYLTTGITMGSDKIVYDADLEAMDRAAEQSFEVEGIPYPFEAMQEHTGGIKPGELVTVAAASGTGKTMFACLQALAAKKAGWNVYFASLEMSTSEIARRLELVTAKTVSPSLYTSGKISEESKAKMHDARRVIADMPGNLVIETPPYEDCTMESLMARAKMNNCNLIIVDQLQWVTLPNGYSARWMAIEEVMETVHQMLRNSPDGIHLAMLLLVQMNSSGAKAAANGGMGDQSDIAMSGRVAQVSDSVWGLAREDVNTMKLACLKSRRYRSIGWKLDWEFGTRCEFDIKRDLNGDIVELDEW